MKVVQMRSQIKNLGFHSYFSIGDHVKKWLLAVDLYHVKRRVIDILQKQRDFYKKLKTFSYVISVLFLGVNLFSCFLFNCVFIILGLGWLWPINIYKMR